MVYVEIVLVVQSPNENLAESPVPRVMGGCTMAMMPGWDRRWTECRWLSARVDDRQPLLGR